MLTAATLEEAIRTGRPEQVRELFAGVSEDERRAVASIARRWQEVSCDRRMNQVPPPGFPFPDTHEEQQLVYNAAAVGLLATTTLGELKRLGWKAFFLCDLAYQALVERHPTWLAEWAEWALQEQRGVWLYVRRMVREGLLPRPSCDAYTTAMLGWVWPKDPLELLRSDPELLEHEVWRLFEVEGGGEDSLAARDKYGKGRSAGWTAALLTLSQEGQLDRQRLLDASLQALQRDFSQFRVGWFSRFHEALAPTPEERAARVETYLALLGNPIPPTVAFALRALAVVDKAGALPDDRLLDQIVSALSAREKGTVTQALKLLERALRRQPALAARGASIATEALFHESPEVQGLALDLLEKQGDPANPELTARLRDLLEGVAPSLRGRLEVWLGAGAATGSEAEASNTNAPSASAALSAFIAQAETLPPSYRALAGVEAALQHAQAASLDLPPLDLRSLAFPRLDPSTRLSPVRDLDTLLELFSRVLENDGPPDDVERVLEGVSRLCGERSEGWEARVAPLRKRAGNLLGKTKTSLREDLARLATAWLTGQVPDPPSEPQTGLPAFLSMRILALSVRASAGQTAPLLGAPTHSGGWIEPRVLVARVREWQAGLPPAPTLSPAVRAQLGDTPETQVRFEAALALLRLAPDGRAEALAEAGDLRGELGDAVRYALGGEGLEIGPTAALWVAASRARAPWSDDPALEARHPGLGPGASRMPQAEIRFRSLSSSYSDHTWVQPYLVTDPAIPETAPLDLATVLHYVDVGRENRWERSPADQRWCATVWPLSREAWCTTGAYALLDNIDWYEAQWANRVWLEVLLNPDTHLGAMEGRLLLYGLGAKESGESSLATDIAITAISDGRLTAPWLGELLRETLVWTNEGPAARQRRLYLRQQDPARVSASSPDAAANGLLVTQPVKGARLAKTLGEVARSSPLHAETVRQGLELGLVTAADQRPVDLGALLQLLQQLCVQSGAAVSHPETRAALQALPGSGKAVKLSKAVLALAETPIVDQRLAAAAQALAGRIARAERWNQWKQL